MITVWSREIDFLFLIAPLYPPDRNHQAEVIMMRVTTEECPSWLNCKGGATNISLFVALSVSISPSNKKFQKIAFFWLELSFWRFSGIWGMSRMGMFPMEEEPAAETESVVLP